MPDRGVSPPIKNITQLKLPMPQKITLSNGIPVYVVNMGTQDIFKIEVIFEAGRPFEHKKMVARATTSLLKEGTRSKSAAEIAELLDFYGSSLSLPVNLDTSNVILFGLNKHFDKMISLITELLMEPVFPQKELNSYLENSKQRLLVDLAQVDVVSYRAITEYIYGKEHPYGYNSQPELYGQISREDLVKHWEKNFIANNCKIIISGKISDTMLKKLDQYLGKLPIKSQPKENFPPIIQQTPKKVKINQVGAIQTSIRIGRQLFNKHHPDFRGLLFLNTVLGGYFGSRLMTNVREDKGYTYNIYSTIDALHRDGYFYIGTEVGTAFAEPALKEIYKEIDLLSKEKISEKELQMVKNYMLGNLLTMLDGTFNVSDVVKTIVMEQLGFDSFEKLVESIHQTTPDQLQKLAQQYLRKEDMWEVVVGA